MASSTRARSAPDTRVLPPARMFTTVPTVAPAPGRPPTRPAAMLPKPWPMSSWLGLCRVRVIESAISDVSRLSTAPSRASVMAGCTAPAKTPNDSTGCWSSGRPEGTSPMTGASPRNSTPMSVPTARAASVAGNQRCRRAGQKMHTPKLTTAMATAPAFRFKIASGQARITSSGPPPALSTPRAGSVCRMMMMMPTPDMKPEITEYGV